MFEILLYLFEHYAKIETTPERAILAIKLNAAGFEGNEIEQVLDWLSDLNQIKQAQSADILCHSHAIRVYTGDEMHRLETTGVSFLGFIERSGMINARQREWIIHQVMSLGEGQDIEQQMRWITLVALWSQHPDQSIMLLEDMLFNQNASPTLH